MPEKEANPLDELLSGRRARILELAAGCGAGRVRLLDPLEMGGRPGEEVFLLVRMDPQKTLLDICPVEEELGRLLGRPVLIIPEESLHPDQARRLAATAREI